LSGCLMKTCKQNSFDYSQIQGIPEVALRVELLQERLQYLSQGTQPRILEIGVGSGDITLMLARNFKEVICVDMDRKNCDLVLDRLEEIKLGHVQFICSSVEEATLPAENFDHIILQNILEHLKDPIIVLKHLAKSLKQSGVMHISVPLANSFHRWLGVSMGLISGIEELAETDIQYGHYRVYTPQLLKEHIKTAWLKVSYEQPFYLKPLPTSVLTPLSMEIHRSLFSLGQKFSEFASYMYLEVMR